jgi:integrase
MSKRSFREGNVSKNKVKANGKEYVYWVARISRPGTFEGRRQRDAKSFKTEKDAKDWLRDRLRHTPRKASKRLTVAEWVPEWLDGKQPQLKPRVRQRTEQIFRDHVNPIIGSIPLDQVTVDDVLRLLKAVQRKPGRGGKRMDSLKIYVTARGAFTDALQRDKIDSNPFVKVEAPDGREPNRTILSPEEATTLLKVIDHHPHAPLYVLGLGSGKRLGECLGVGWDCFTPDWSGVWVRQELQWLTDEFAYPDGQLHEDILRVLPYTAARDGKTKPYLVTPKGKVRLVPLASPIAAILKAYKLAQVNRHGIQPDNGLVFLSEQGTPLRPDNVDRDLVAFCKAAEVPSVTFHELRHSCNAALEALGVDAETRAAILGHAVDVNVKTYTSPHITTAQKQRAVDLLADLIPA